MLPPRPRPRERIISTSLVKPKVRARAISRLYWPDAHVELDALAGLVDRRVVELDLEAELVALERARAAPTSARAPSPSRTSTGFFTRRKRLGASCSSMPALCSRNTNDAAEPSRMGTSSAVMSTIEVVQPEAGAGRQQVLDRLHLGRARVAAGRQRGGHARVADRRRPTRGSPPAAAGRRAGTRCRCRAAPGAASARPADRRARPRRPRGSWT